MLPEIERRLRTQAGVISRRQACAAGLRDHDLRRLLRRHEWATLHAGVYVEHTGPPTWLQRAWAGVLYAWPAALSHDSALRAADGPGRRDRHDDDPLHVAVDRGRAFAAPPGIVPHRLVDLSSKVQWNLGPPRVRLEHAVLDVAAEAVDDFAAIAVIAQAVGSRRTTAPRITSALQARSRIARRDLLTGVLQDVAAGTCSVLEHGYLVHVERAHGLPRGRRQAAATSSRGSIFRDVDHDGLGLVVELDGRLFHDSAAARDRDLDRDLDAAVDGRHTVRLGWGQVLGRPCSTAARLSLLFQQRGWRGRLTPCPACPGDGVGSQSPGGWDPTLSA